MSTTTASSPDTSAIEEALSRLAAPVVQGIVLCVSLIRVDARIEELTPDLVRMVTEPESVTGPVSVEPSLMA
ncbi:hypothetical protein [Streptomyces fragilis]|uniref:Uncharacterized protein n=1 Tax=Streptomyces fragilis TaxID=67301 RepID=A0ABV2YJD6_9ACTN|nr:hypothetical protein [Streptomyces fragilis]